MAIFVWVMKLNSLLNIQRLSYISDMTIFISQFKFSSASEVYFIVITCIDLKYVYSITIKFLVLTN